MINISNVFRTANVWVNTRVRPMEMETAGKPAMTNTVGATLAVARMGLRNKSAMTKIVLNHDFSKIFRISKIFNPANLINLVKISVLTIAFLGLSLGAKAQSVIQSWQVGPPIATDVIATLYSDSTFIVSGTGAMTDFSYPNYAPWYNSYRTLIKTVIIGDSVTSIGNSAFYYCWYLTSVSIGDSVKSIGNSAFYYCSGLKSVTIPNNVTSIGNNAFQACYILASITIPNSVTDIGWQAFSNCDSLTSVTIPYSVTSLAGTAFLYSYGLTSINVGGTYNFNGKQLTTDSIYYDTLSTINGCDSIIELTLKVGSVGIPQWTIDN